MCLYYEEYDLQACTWSRINAQAAAVGYDILKKEIVIVSKNLGKNTINPVLKKCYCSTQGFFVIMTSDWILEYMF
jgi:hypothetical protein